MRNISLWLYPVCARVVMAESLDTYALRNFSYHYTDPVSKTKTRYLSAKSYS